jgi:hypothetical protein
MPNAPWPAGLPQAPLNGALQIQTEDTAVFRFKADAGFTIRRQRPFLSVDTQSIQMIMSTAQLAILDVFYKTTLQRGVLPFDFYDWSVGALREFSFASPPQKSAMGIPNLWSVSLSLERKGE